MLTAALVRMHGYRTGRAMEESSAPNDKIVTGNSAYMQSDRSMIWM